MIQQKKKPFVSVVLPAYNEEAIIEISINKISEYVASLQEKYKFEILLINDGSKDRPER